MTSINWLAVFVVAIIQFTVGMVWYSPFILGKQWVKLRGDVVKDTENKFSVKMMIGSFVAAFITATVLAYLVILTAVGTFLSGMWLGAFLWLGFIAATFVTDVLYENKKIGLYLISIGYFLIAIVLMGGVLAIWQ
jgi:hypothetical protein